MRMSRLDWLRQFVRSAPRTGPKLKKKSSAAARRVRQLPAWTVKDMTKVRFAGGRLIVHVLGTVRARTKSEARAEAKKMLGLPRRERLPVGTVMDRVKGG